MKRQGDAISTDRDEGGAVAALPIKQNYDVAWQWHGGIRFGCRQDLC
jgi:hypothetical protein